MGPGIPLSTLVGPASGHAGGSLLIVDRSPDRRLFLQSALRRPRRAVAVASSGREGIERLRDGAPCGMILGGLSGEGQEALRVALGSEPRPAVLELWATRPPSDWADLSLRHPFTRAELVRAVGRLLRDGRTREAGTHPEESSVQR